MAFDEHLANRIRAIFREKNILFEEKRMMGGLCIMVRNKMCVGVVKDKLMARVGDEESSRLLLEKGVQPMDFNGRTSRGFVFVQPQAIDMDEDLVRWINICLAFNPRAKAARK